MDTSLDSFFARQLAIYASYHRDERNRATHFIGIPAIVFSILVPLALVRVDGISLAVPVALLALIGWIALDRVIGLAMVVALLPMLIVAEWIARSLWQRNRLDRLRRFLRRRLAVPARRPRLGGPPPGAGR